MHPLDKIEMAKWKEHKWQILIKQLEEHSWTFIQK